MTVVTIIEKTTHLSQFTGGCYTLGEEGDHNQLKMLGFKPDTCGIKDTHVEYARKRVIPAKAGIQNIKRHISRWIPAFAGMTRSLTRST